MPKATAVWLIENTMLTFRQIADFTLLTEIEVEALANEEIGRGLVGRNPLENRELTQDEITRCEADTSARLKQAKRDLPPVKTRAKGPRYTPISKRGDKPDAIAYILKNHTEITDAQICKLVGTTKPTIASVRDRSHPNTPNLRPRHPAELGLCTYQEFENVLTKALKAAGKDPETLKAQMEAERAKQEEFLAQQQQAEDADKASGGFDFSNFLSSGGAEPPKVPDSEEKDPFSD
ncbi:MAG: DUF1013 domain-containing protein [Rhodospirillales bacterium]|nr:DUF1013 domain-containing protein [Alphaproteobacteria bacterium]MCB1839611.1 DUF1013 domain-containing protein [Alphaproteobacteria bacterium]MCB9976159.1 DUF1013 domain-containing protein [Rhodospirillales bacterium]